MEQLLILTCLTSAFAILLALAGRVEIVSIHNSGDPTYVNISTFVHSNRTAFDVDVIVLRQLRMHDLIMNMRLRMKANHTNTYRILYSWNRIDLCKFLTTYDSDILFKYIFKTNNDAIKALRCPIRKGRYHLENFGLITSLPTGTLAKGRYKFFCEIAQASGEVVKVFAMQITTDFYDD